MLKNVKFSYKMMIMPGLVIIVLLGLLFVTQFFNERNTVLLSQIESGFVPALEWAYNLEGKLTAFQRSIQDAVAAADEEELVTGDALAAEFLELLREGQKFSIVGTEDIKYWETAFQDYYTHARETSIYLIEGGSLTEETIKELESLKTEYNTIKQETQSKIEQAKEYVSKSFAATQKNNALSATIMSVSILCCALLLGGLSVLLTRSITKPLGKVIAVANELARGNADVTIEVDSKDEIGILANIFAGLIDTNKNLANAATAIGNGDYSVPVNVRSDDDMLGNALAVMKTNLVTSSQEIEKQSWLKTGLTELNFTLRGEKDTVELAQQVISYLAVYLDAQIGAICVADDKQTLRMIGSYAYSECKGRRNAFQFGEGLIGQAALEKQRIVFTNVPDDYIKISSELGEVTPHYILVTPFLYENTVKGVIELGTVHHFTETQIEFLEQACESIAIAVHSAQSRSKMQELLEETQRQSETLQTQQEKLQQTNEELAEQTRALRVSEERLQAQQEELRQTNEELEEQTHALERQKKALATKNRELLKAQRLIEEKAHDLELASKYKSEFLANMSHELRTPLNSLLILSKLLAENKEGNLTEKQVEFAQTVHAAGSELLDLIDEVLDLSKIEAGRMALNIEAMSLKGLISYVKQNFAHVAKKKGLKLKSTLAKGLPASIFTDRQRVEQIVKNLLSNALKFTSKGEVCVRIGRPTADVDLSQRGLEPQQTIAISVSDTGIGIPKDKQQLIFKAFQQADGTTSRKYGGTGLGLSIVQEFSKLLGGEIQLYSEKEKGSIFTLYLPEVFSQEEKEETQKTRDVGQAANEEKQKAEIPSAFVSSLASAILSSGIESIWDDRHDKISSTDKSLLIIEDDPKFAKILFDLARERGFKGLIAGDGAAGLQLAYQYTPSAIILDIVLPGMDGWTVMEKLKQNPETRHIPVHFISAGDQPLDAWKMGAIGYLTKPVNMDQLNTAFQAIEEEISKTIKRLLIVEDDENAQFHMTEMLSGDDVEVTIAQTGEEAYRLLEVESFDCMVLDLGLEDISGFELLEKVHADVEISHLPIIIYTGKELSKEEDLQLKKYAESIVIKGVKSLERLLDEVTLFLHRVEANLPKAQQKQLRMLHDKEAVLSGKTVLMVDDDMRNVFAISSVLEERGMHVFVGEHGKEALNLLEQHPEIDVVLMDIMMPEMDGYETIGHIRKESKFKDLPIIALTAKAMKGDRQRCIDAGASDYLAKPVDTNKLLSLLRVWLY
jgi:CheY-like chemotaxis protein